MRYHRVTSTAPAIEHLSARLSAVLGAGKSVLWLLSGGSGAAVCVAVSQRLAADGIDTSRLFMTMSDERYGPVGHADENIQQLLDAGFDTGDGTLYRPLIGEPRAVTTRRFADWLEATRAACDVTIAALGIGPDGHTAGIKPGSPAVTSAAAAVDFGGDDFERITICGGWLAHIDEAVVQAMGEAKWPTLRRLFDESVSPDEQPAQLIKQIASVDIFTDYDKEKSS